MEKQKNTPIPTTHRHARSWFPALILIASLFATFTMSRIMQLSEEEYLEERFNAESDKLIASIEDRIQQYVQVLRGGQALFAASTSVERNEWEQYYTALNLPENLPGIQAFAYSKYLPTREIREETTALIHSEGYPEFAIYPEASNRQEVHSIIYIEPMDERNKQAFGYDMSSELVRREAMHMARDTGKPTLSGRVTLVQEITEDVQPGTLLYVPVYMNEKSTRTVSERESALVGFVYAAFRMGDLFSVIVNEEEDFALDFSIYDGAHDEHEVASLLYTNESHEEDYVPKFEAVRAIKVVGRQWHVHIHSQHNFGEGYVQNSSNIVLFMGCIISFILALMTYMGTRTQVKAMSIAADMTKALRDSEERLRSIYAISSTSSMALEDQLRQMLDVGCVQLGMENGLIAKIENDIYQVQFASSSDRNTDIAGKEFPLGKTYCSIVMQSDDTVAIESFGTSKYSNHPCYTEFKLESYIGIKLVMNGRVYGTLSFSSSKIKKTPFTDEDKELVRLIARFVSTALERKMTMSSLQDQRDELQRANDLMVGREMKMQDLKKKTKNVFSHLILMKMHDSFHKRIGLLLSLAVAVVSIVVIVGWIFDITVLKSILPNWVTMKFSTALSFLISATLLGSAILYRQNYHFLIELVLIWSTMLLLLIMASLLIGVALDIGTGIEDLFVRELAEAVFTVAPGRPSVGTMANFVLIGIAGLVMILRSEKEKFLITAAGLIIGLNGIVALMGYALAMPMLYFHVEGISTAMAFHTALLFVLLGTGLLFSVSHHFRNR